VTPLYDPMIAKLIVWDTDRERATARMLRALSEYEIGGLVTLIPFHRAILATEQWRRAETCRDLIGDRDWLRSLAPEEPAAAAAKPDGKGAAEEAPSEVREYKVEVDGRLHEVRVIGAAPVANNPGPAAAIRRPPRRERAGGGAAAGAAAETLVSPIQGSVLKVPVSKGDEVDEGALICVIEAMKMENEITAHRGGKVTELRVAEGGSVAAGETIARIE
jgi:acetyl-CoA/propionyl-CoA carboxylase biotin carboxyl carrier protein